MNRTLSCFGFCLGGALFAATLSTATAATITYAGVTNDLLWNGDSSAFTWQQFDPLAGQLNSVTYNVSGAYDFSLSHTAPFPITPSYSVSKGFTLNGTGLRFKPIGAAPFDGMINTGWNSAGLLQPGVTRTQSLTLDFLRAPDFGLAPFIGSGSISTVLGLSADSDQCFSYDLANTPYSISCSQSGRLTVSVTYDYTPAATVPASSTPVPEPASFYVLGLGLLTAASLRKARHRAFVGK